MISGFQLFGTGSMLVPARASAHEPSLAQSRSLLPLSLMLTLYFGAPPCLGVDRTGGIAGSAAGTSGVQSSATAGRVAMNRSPVESKHRTAHRADIRGLIRKTARRHGVEPALVEAVVSAESAYDAGAVSHAGAIGLMQVMPATAADYGIMDSADLFDPFVNVDTGVRHLKRLLRKYGNDYGRVIMAYNAGEGAVDRTNSRVRYTETLDYVEAVVRRYRRLGGVKPTDDVLTRVSRLRGPGTRRSNAEKATGGKGHAMFLPSVSPRLQDAIPSSPLNVPAQSREASDGDHATRSTSGFVGEVRRTGVDPVIRHATRPAGGQGYR